MKNKVKSAYKGFGLKNIFSSFEKSTQLPALTRDILKNKSNREMFLEHEEIKLEPDYKPQKGGISQLNQLKKRLMYRWNKAVAGFRGHFPVFLAVSAFLIFLNITTGSHHPWAYYPIFGWGIGVLSHFQSLRNRKREMEEILPLKGISSDDLLRIRKIQKSTSGFRDHLMVYVSVIGFLFGINLITSGLSPSWFIYPAGGWFIGLFAHFNSYIGYKRSQLSQLDHQFQIESSEIPKTEVKSQKQKISNRVFEKARVLKEKLFSQWRENKDLQMLWGEEAPDLLNHYIQQISELCEREAELTELLQEINAEEKDKKLAELEEKLGKANNPMLVKEYEGAIEQTKHHIKALRTIAEQKELIVLRIDAAVSLLEQMQLSAARMQGIDKMAENQSLQELKAKTRELSDYLDDLETSYNELDL
ncbi:MAG: 2TM domain-containing protein [Spirochaetales bacterium]|nr:2TM domain-containing protein [Spirochaetales bacterium]